MHHSPMHGVLGPCFTSLLMLSSCSGGFLGARGRGRGNGGVRTTLLQLHEPWNHPCARVESSRGRDSNLIWSSAKRERAPPPGYAIMKW